MKKILIKGLIAGLVMGIGLFITGAIASRIIYGPQMVPEGKFEPGQINAWYFIWTKLVIGIFFGIIFTWIYSKFPMLTKSSGLVNGLVFSFSLWLIIALWSISHPLVYESIATKDQLFWHIYTLGGFLSYGITIGGIFKK
jgi:hypothetical protein